MTLDDIFRAPELDNLHPVCERRIGDVFIVAGTCPSYRDISLEISRITNNTFRTADFAITVTIFAVGVLGIDYVFLLVCSGTTR